MRIVVGMSGGVDSSAAAAILAGEGHEVVGMTLRLLDASEPGRGRSCCTPDDVQDARAAARKLGIPHYVADAEERFSRAVVDGFVEDYLAGLTPNPCVACNEEVKFGWLLARARALGAKLATGHYARAERAGGRWVLRAARHPAKDQSYFLHRLGQEELADLLFPLGDLEKPDVRRIAAHHGLPAADKVESQEACFVGRGTAAEFVELRAPERLSPGEVLDTSGEVLGRHPGVHHFTVGQRRGLGIGGGAARYVVELDPGLSRVVVGTAAEASRDRFHVGGVRWVAGRPPPGPVELLVKVRHRHQGELGAVTPVDGGAVVCLAAAVRGVAPGQSAVFYAGDEVVGGGRILRG